METDAWENELKELKKNKKQYQEIYSMNSSDEFRLMKNFAEQLKDINFLVKLNDALSEKKLFADFKFTLDISGEYRELWFAFKEQRFTEWKQNQLNH